MLLPLLRAGCLFLLLAAPVRPAHGAERAPLPPVFAQFNDWWQQYLDASDADRPGLVKKGTFLAAKRRDAMLQLIASDPQTALQLAFAEEYHSALPKPVADSVEQHVRGLATLTVTRDTDGTVTRTITMDDQSWQAALYGSRLQLASREEIPIHGIILDGRMAVDGSPLERFPARESLLQVLRQEEGKKTCPICGKPGVIPAAVGDILLWFDTQKDLQICEKALIEKEAQPQVSQ